LLSSREGCSFVAQQAAAATAALWVLPAQQQQQQEEEACAVPRVGLDKQVGDMHMCTCQLQA